MKSNIFIAWLIRKAGLPSCVICQKIRRGRWSGLTQYVNAPSSCFCFYAATLLLIA